MPTTTELITEAKTLVQDTHTWVTDPTWTRITKDSVTAYSKKLPMIKKWELSLIAGIDTYAVPADLLYLVDFPTASKWRDGDVLNTPVGLVPFNESLSYPEEVRVQGKSIWVSPTPQSAIDIEAEYAAAHILDVNNDYSTIPDNDISIVLAKMKAMALENMAQKAAEAVDYSEGDTRLVFSARAKQYQELALKAEIAYQKMVNKAAV